MTACIPSWPLIPTPMSAAGGADGGRRVRAMSQEWTSHAGILKHEQVLTLDHVDVVGSVSDRQCHSFLVLLHQTHDVRLLLGCDSTADDRLALTGHVYKVNLWVIFHFVSVHPRKPSFDGCALYFVDINVPVSSPSPSRPWAVRPEGCWEAGAFQGDADAADGASSSFHTESRSRKMKTEPVVYLKANRSPKLHF